MYLWRYKHKNTLKMRTKTNIINREACILGKNLSSIDRKLIEKKIGVVPSAVANVLSGTRRAVRGKSLQIVEMARRIAEINRQKEKLV